jgi:secreted PhoX family phosphatase
MAAGRARGRVPGFGPLVPDPAGILDLPAGFRYTAFSRVGTDLLDDGRPVPSAHDGMAAFPTPGGNVRLVRNHEGREPAATSAPIGDPARSYDQRGTGGTTTLEVEVGPDGGRRVVRDHVSISGTHVNCAGGPTPWGSWLTCEETTEGEAQGRGEAHGYVFEVPAAANDEVDPVPFKAMGRFVHEAVAVDPRSGIIYETEDRATSGFYRFIPDRPGRLGSGGRLQMLAIKDRPNYDTATGQRVGKSLPVTWVDIDDPDPAAAETNDLAVYEQGAAQGAASFSRLEGCWWGDGSVVFNATSGGDAELGQVWQYRPRGRSGGQLSLVFESPSAEVLDSPDNITVSPGGAALLCEDGDDGNYVRGVTQRGRIFDFARNAVNDREFAGATFGPDGETLFLNIQGATSGAVGDLGMTFAIWGPFEEGAL